MKKDEELRKEVRILKALSGTTYKEISEYLEISDSSFRNWLSGQYNFSIERKQRLNDIITNLSEV